MLPGVTCGISTAGDAKGTTDLITRNKHGSSLTGLAHWIFGENNKMLAAVYSESLTGNTLHSFNTSNSLNCVLLGEICCSQNEGHVNGFCLLVHGDMLCMCTQEALY